MNELRIWGHSNIVIDTKQEKIKEKNQEGEAGWGIVSRRKNQEKIKIKIEKNSEVVGFKTSHTQKIFLISNLH